MNRKRLPALMALACLVASGTAHAVKPGGTLYIKAKNTHLKASSSPTADTLAVLQPGQAVTYDGRVAGMPWCQVTVDREKKAPLKGLVYQGNLSVSPPSLELSSKAPAKPLSPEAFASSGAAIKALGPGAIEYGKTLARPESVQQLIKLEQLAKDIDERQIAAYAREAGLPEVVGRPEVASLPKKPTSRSTQEKKP